MKTKTLLFTAIAILTCIVSAQAQNVNIPDANFKAALVGNGSINTNGDAEIQTSEAAAYTGGIHVSQLGITDFTGLEEFILLDSLDCGHNAVGYYDQDGFWILISSPLLNVSVNTALTYLNCSGNALTSLDVSTCTALKALDCSGNQFLTSLDVSACTALTYLDCNWNQLITLDVSGCIALTYLQCFGNQLSSLNVTDCIALNDLNCAYNQLTSLNVSGCFALSSLQCYNNQLSSIDVSTITALYLLDCNNNELTSLDVSSNLSISYLVCNNNVLTSLDVSNNLAISYLVCNNNQLTSLDVSNLALSYFECFSNQLTSLDVSASIGLNYFKCYNNLLISLDVRNGHNNWIPYYDFNASDNPNLFCIEVDNAAWSNANWYNIDATASFSENCSGAGISNINESNAPMFYPNPTSGMIYLSEQSNITLIDLSGKLLLEEKNTTQLDLSSLPAGMYFLRVGENNNQLFKVIKE